uniref:DNA polymerase exonuclease subunit n=1 Tax=Ochrobactrum phage ORM_20 TaxID=2985243 RepID=A0A9N6WTQ0_9VIRU|nr:DNA polymerase exonuclease subunit [Ochrobactrum phage ORM_20]
MSFNGDGWVIGQQVGDERRLFEMPRELFTDLEIGQNIGLAMDVETTGLDHDEDEIIAFGYVKFTFDDSCRITSVIEANQFFNEPSKEIPEEITKLTGITMDQVKGHSLTKEMLDKIYDGVEISIAHNAKFDRKFIDKHYRSDIIWGCSNADLDLRGKYTIPSGSLGVVMAYVKDWYFGHHDALEDCWALIHLLNTDDHLKEIIEKAFIPNYNVFATGSPFEMKDILKNRGYKWMGDTVKCWYYPRADEEKMNEEADWLKENHVNPNIVEISRFDRHL